MICWDCTEARDADSHVSVAMCSAGAAGGECEEPGFHHEFRLMDPADHCFREDSPTNACRDCGELPEVHTGCDCEAVPSVLTSGSNLTIYNDIGPDFLGRYDEAER